MNQMTTTTPHDTAFRTPPSPRIVVLNEQHARALRDILKRTSRASHIENDWILHTIDVIDSQLSLKR